MANRYDRDTDDHGYGRRDVSRDEDEQRFGQYAQNRSGDYRQNQRQNPWRDVRNERDRNERHDSDYRARSDQDYRNQGTWRGSDYADNNYYSGRENMGRDYGYSSGRDLSGFGDRDQRGGYGNYERDRGYADSQRRGERQGWDRGNWERDRGNYRGLYQEQVWARDPSSGNVYGYEYSTRIDPRHFNAGDESRDRWRTNVNDQNRRFDIDRGWHTPGTSGYGNAGSQNQYGQNPQGQSQYGRGPKGYVRSDERIREDVCDRLSDDDEIDARDITVTVKSAEVILEGTVNDRRSKHRAEDIAESVSGVKDVTNHLRARKGFLQELGDKISGDDEAEHHGHRGSGTRNSPAGIPQKTAH
jgi:osmotically-inducible protein OsmY